MSEFYEPFFSLIPVSLEKGKCFGLQKQECLEIVQMGVLFGMEHSFNEITPLYDLAFTCKLVPSLSLYDINRTTRSYFLVTYVHFDVQKIFK